MSKNLGSHSQQEGLKNTGQKNSGSFDNSYAYKRIKRKLKYLAIAVCIIAYIALFSVVLQIRDAVCSYPYGGSSESAISSENHSPAETGASISEQNAKNSDTFNEQLSSTTNTVETISPSVSTKYTVKVPNDSSESSSYDQSPEYYEKQAVADLAIQRYYNAEWDGTPEEIDGHTVSISEDFGYLLVDGYMASPSDIHPQHVLDLPPETINNHTALYIPGDGTYDLVNNRLVKYSCGNEVHLSGGPLNWNGMDTENYRPYDVYFYYDKAHDTLFLVASSVPYDYSSEKLKYNVGIYLYVIPNRTKSELKFVDEIINLNIDDEGLFYQDTSQKIWRYAEKDDILQFVRASDKLTSKFSKTGIAEGEIEFDWWCTFADGFIGKREPAFPDGTFSHPVVTTPSVSLSDYVANYRYKNIYSY